MSIQLAEDSDALKTYYHQQSLAGLFDYEQSFKKSFFDIYHTLSHEHYTFKMGTSEIMGAISFIVKEVVLEGRLRRIAYAKDLKISNHREAILGWSENYQPTLEKIRKDYQCDYIFSYINDFDLHAKNTFIRPKKRRPFYPRYHFFRKASLVTLHGQYPMASNPLPDLKIVKCTPAYEDELVYYLIQNSKNNELNALTGPESLLKQLTSMNDLKLSDFWIALDHKNNIIGTLVPWNIENIISLKPKSYSNLATNFKQFTGLVKYLGWTRPFTTPLQMTLLSFVHCDHPDIFEALLWKAWKESPKNHFLVYAYARLNFKYRRPLSWVSARIPYTLYSILDSNEPPPAFLHPSNERLIECDPLLLW